MPLKKGASNKTRSENIAAEIRAGKSKEQAAAIRLLDSAQGEGREEK